MMKRRMNSIGSLGRNFVEWRQVYIQVLLISLVTSIMVGGVLLYKNYNILKSEIQRQEREIHEVATLLAPVVEGFDLVSVKGIGASLEARPYIGRVVITGPSQYIMYGNKTPDTSGATRTLSLPLPGLNKKNNTTIGQLFVTMETRSASDIFKEATLIAAGLFIAIMVVGVTISMAYALFYVARPLRQLYNAVETTLESGLPVKTEVSDSGFIGKFQNQFNRMQTELLTSQVEIRNKTLELESNAKLIQELLSNVNQSVRIYRQDSHTDFGEERVDFLFPDKPYRSVERLKEALAVSLNRSGFEITRTSSHADADSVLYELELSSDVGQYYNVKFVDLQAEQYALLVTDISQAREVENTLRRAERMEIVGRLTSGIAHDFNNILGIIVGSVEIIRFSAEQPATVLRYANKIQYAARQASTIVNSLLSFSKRAPEKISHISVNELLLEFDSIAQTSIGPNLELTTRCDLDAVIQADISSLQSALINLVINARDAMPQGGCIQVTARLSSKEDVNDNDLNSARSYVTISVRDEGTGIAPSLESKIFETFFTTKSHGTGLGLVMAKNVAQQAQGELIYRKNKKRGSEFSIILPVVTVAMAELSAPHKDNSPGRYSKATRGARVWLIEDNDHVREVLAEVLVVSGYECIQCTGLYETRKLLQEKAEVPDIIVTDLNLGDGLGTQLLSEEFSALNPVPKILMSGNMESNQDPANTHGFDELLLKPTEHTILVNTIEKLLS